MALPPTRAPCPAAAGEYEAGEVSVRVRCGELVWDRSSSAHQSTNALVSDTACRRLVITAEAEERRKSPIGRPGSCLAAMRCFMQRHAVGGRGLQTSSSSARARAGASVARAGARHVAAFAMPPASAPPRASVSLREEPLRARRVLASRRPTRAGGATAPRSEAGDRKIIAVTGGCRSHRTTRRLARKRAPTAALR
eukprot:360291-Chlamydomonas_euryale.AAC.2